MKGFWNSTIALLDDMASQGMIRGNWHDYIEVATSLSELQQIVERWNTNSPIGYNKPKKLLAHGVWSLQAKLEFKGNCFYS